MALWANVMVNGNKIGGMYVQRRNGGLMTPDTVSEYDWEVMTSGRVVKNDPGEPLSHRYGDGAWALVAKVIAAFVCRSEAAGRNNG